MNRHRPLSRDIEYYQGRAFGLHSVWQTGQERALQIIQQRHPRFGAATLDEIRTALFTLDDAKLVLAREHGFASWEELAMHVEAMAEGRVVEPFHQALEAIKAGDLSRLQTIIAGDPALLSAQGTNGNSLLNLTVALRKVEIGRWLVEAGADIELANNKGWMPLHAAAYGAPEADQGASVALLQMLLDAGAKIDVSAHGDGGTPLVQALFWGHRPQAEMLAERGIAPANLRAAAGLGRVDLLPAFFHRDGTLTPQAITHREFHRPHSGFPPHRPSDDPQEVLDDALSYAARNGRVEAMGFLVEHGADVNSEPYNGTPLMWAVSRKQTAAVEWLLDHGADVNRPGGMGGAREITPLHCAAWAGNLELTRLLVARGADPTLKDPQYDGTPHGWATHFGHTEVADWLELHA